MSAEFFLDTNILVYTFDPHRAEKRTRARELVESALQNDAGVITYQVVQEFLNVCTRKFAVPMTPDDVRDYLKIVLEPLCMVFPSMALYERAIALHERWRYGFHDSLTIGSALEAPCSLLYSEDLHDRQKVESLTIVHPFVAGGPT
ncbi:MAG: PIN domain-containing protein [Gammaproteobacteria bacterium]